MVPGLWHWSLSVLTSAQLTHKPMAIKSDCRLVAVQWPQAKKTWNKQFPRPAQLAVRSVAVGLLCLGVHAATLEWTHGDGWCDIYLCGLENGNRLYRNLGGWKFEDITESAGVACSNQYSTGAVFADE